MGTDETPIRATGRIPAEWSLKVMSIADAIEQDCHDEVMSSYRNRLGVIASVASMVAVVCGLVIAPWIGLTCLAVLMMAARWLIDPLYKHRCNDARRKSLIRLVASNATTIEEARAKYRELTHNKGD